MSFEQGLPGLHATGKRLEKMVGSKPAPDAALPWAAACVNRHLTTRIAIDMNLDLRSGPTAPLAGPSIVFANPRTYNNAASLTVYDAQGQPVPLVCYFQKSTTGTWNVFVTANGVPVSLDARGDPLPVTTITFPDTGASPAAPAVAVTFDIPAGVDAHGAQTAAMSRIVFDVSAATQRAAAFGITNFFQDGDSAGQLDGRAAPAEPSDSDFTAQWIDLIAAQQASRATAQAMTSQDQLRHKHL